MQSVHESFTNTDLTRFVEDPRVLAVISRIGLLRRQAFTNTNLTNWLVEQGRITGTGFWISGDRLFFENNLSPEIQKPVPVILCPRDSFVFKNNIVINSFPV